MLKSFSIAEKLFYIENSLVIDFALLVRSDDGQFAVICEESDAKTLVFQKPVFLRRNIEKIIRMLDFP